jgi:hypothetical protein
VVEVQISNPRENIQCTSERPKVGDTELTVRTVSRNAIYREWKRNKIPRSLRQNKQFRNDFGLSWSMSTMGYALITQQIGTIPTVEKLKLEYISPYWQKVTRDGKNLLQLVLKESIDLEDEDDNFFDVALSRRIAFVKWLLNEYPPLFIQASPAQPEALSIVIEGYNATNPYMSRANRAFTKYFLSDPSLDQGCRVIFNKPEKSVSGSQKESRKESHKGSPQGSPRRRISKIATAAKKESSSRAHMAIKEMGVEIIPYLDLINSSTLRIGGARGNTPLHVALEVADWKEDELAQERVKLIAELVRRCPEALTIFNGEEGLQKEKRWSPYLYHQEQCNLIHDSKERRCQNESCKEVQNILTEAYIRLLDHLEAAKHLYNGKQGMLELCV